MKMVIIAGLIISCFKTHNIKYNKNKFQTILD